MGGDVVSPLLEPFRAGAVTLLGALENLMLIDEHGLPRAGATSLLTSTAVVRQNGSDYNGHRRGSERSVHREDSLGGDRGGFDSMELDHNGHSNSHHSGQSRDNACDGMIDASPLKRKRDVNSFPLPDAKSSRISAQLASRFQQILKVTNDKSGDDDDESISSAGLRGGQGRDISHSPGTSNEDGTASMDSGNGRVHNVRRLSSRRASRFNRPDNLPLHLDVSSYADPAQSSGLSSPSATASPLFGLSRGSSCADLPYPATMNGSQSQVSLNPVLDAMSITAWLEHQAKQNNLPLEHVQMTWNAKRKELEHNLALLANGVPSDSYQDLKSIVEKIMDAARWLSAGNLDELGDYVPAWRMMEPNLDHVVQYLRVIEDMKSTPQQVFSLTGDLAADLAHMRQRIMEKKQVWGGEAGVASRVAAWRVLGFPVMEVEGVVQSAIAWIYGLVWAGFVQVDQDLIRSEAPSPQLWTHVLDLLILARDSVIFCQKPFPPRTLHAAYTLSHLYICTALSHFNGRTPTSSTADLQMTDVTADLPSPASMTPSTPPSAICPATRSASAQVIRRRDHVRVIQTFGHLVRVLDVVRVLSGGWREDAMRRRPGHGTGGISSSFDDPFAALDDDWDQDSAPTPTSAATGLFSSPQSQIPPPISPSSLSPNTPTPSFSPHAQNGALIDSIPISSAAPDVDPSLTLLLQSAVEAGLQLCEHFAEQRAPQSNKLSGSVGSAASARGAQNNDPRRAILLGLVCRYIGVVVAIGGGSKERERLRRVVRRAKWELAAGGG
ncbi:hypothetical protein DFS34DRAFT_55993 [Phlyctochytrium arcticum]|nr:hypothetical protein DFS34DRAFT_55993 [Phlyctochytrium arcticum]